MVASTYFQAHPCHRGNFCGRYFHLKLVTHSSPSPLGKKLGLSVDTGCRGMSSWTATDAASMVCGQILKFKIFPILSGGYLIHLSTRHHYEQCCQSIDGGHSLRKVSPGRGPDATVNHFRSRPVLHLVAVRTIFSVVQLSTVCPKNMGSLHFRLGTMSLCSILF